VTRVKSREGLPSRLSRQKREFEKSGCSLLASAAGSGADIENDTRGTYAGYQSFKNSTLMMYY
jgi:hypothetical protein